MKPIAALTLFALAATPALGKEIAAAAYVEPTDAYGHGAVKDGEYAGLRITYDDGSQNTIRFDGAVYEDTAPRLVDLDGDGGPEVIAVLSGFRVGAMVQVVDFDGEWARPIGQNAPIGTRNRWLAIAGVADFNGDGVPDVAYVDRPHLARTLRLVTVALSDGAVQFEEYAALGGLSNHIIGTPEIEGGVRDCPGEASVVLTANDGWSHIVETRWQDGALVSQRVAPYAGPESFARFLACQ